MSSYKARFKGAEEVMAGLKRYGRVVETEVNKSLVDDVAPGVIRKMTSYMPMSKYLGKGTYRHAKTSKSLTAKLFENFGLRFETTKNFGYLIFPEEGRGRSNPVEQRFIKRGLEDSRDFIMTEIGKALERAAKTD